MIHLTKGETQNIIFTASEKATLTNPYFLFICTHGTTNEVVKFVVTNISTTGRYDKATIETNDYFSASDTGLWGYVIRQQASSSNTDESLSGAIVEEGYLNLSPATDFEPTVYDEQDNEFKTYDIEE